ncbi:hypothetical protein E2C01_060408 [Portunus trituberculatus]|uniref:Uncharacterized protein n=1 Tax=Portunus trituberculatus TaxID=210409 RepID=A0A5B7H127_PORTR|nr:hypothetical protein [Portunus trituberculatus]
MARIMCRLPPICVVVCILSSYLFRPLPHPHDLHSNANSSLIPTFPQLTLAHPYTLCPPSSVTVLHFLISYTLHLPHLRELVPIALPPSSYLLHRPKQTLIISSPFVIPV